MLFNTARCTRCNGNVVHYADDNEDRCLQCGRLKEPVENTDRLPLERPKKSKPLPVSA